MIPPWLRNYSFTCGRVQPKKKKKLKKERGKGKNVINYDI